MKQHISIEDLLQLYPEQQEKLRSLWHPQQGDHFLILGEYEGIVKEYRDNDKVSDYIDPTYGDYTEYDEWKKSDCLPILSIGKMIELIDPEEEAIFTMMKYIASDSKIYRVCVNGSEYFGDTMCYCLWQAVKSIL